MSVKFFFGKVGLAKVGLAKVGQIRMAKVGLAKVGLSRPPTLVGEFWKSNTKQSIHATT